MKAKITQRVLPANRESYATPMEQFWFLTAAMIPAHAVPCLQWRGKSQQLIICHLVSVTAKETYIVSWNSIFIFKYIKYSCETKYPLLVCGVKKGKQMLYVLTEKLSDVFRY